MVRVQKSKSQNDGYSETKHSMFSEKLTLFTPRYVSGGKKCLFFGKFGVLCFL